MSRPRRRNQAAEEVTDDAEFWNIYPTNESYVLWWEIYNFRLRSVYLKNPPF